MCFSGQLITCATEGQVIQPPAGTHTCIKCQCRNKSVRCSKPKCQDADGCHVLLSFKPKTACCHTCRGCLYEGRELLSGEALHSKDICTSITCKSSVVTVSPTKCHVPCDNPVHVEGHCCPVCPAEKKTKKGACRYDNQLVANGDQVALKGDICTKCTCVSGQLSCAKRSCPVLNCPESKIIKDENDCCPRCTGSNKENYPSNGDCIFRGEHVKNGADVSPDTCSKCQCRDGATVCDRDVCHILDCPAHAVINSKGDCCPRCKAPESCSAGEATDEQKRQHDEQWKRETCTTCHCYAGTSTCRTQTCSKKKCRRDMIKVHLAEECCPTCVQSDSKCTVSGSGTENIQYSTFDGKLYTFNGVCKYILAEDNVNNSFSIRIHQGYKHHSAPTTYQVNKVQVLLKTSNNVEVTVTLDTRLIAKVGKSVVKNGFIMPQVYMVENSNSTVSVTLLALKVKVTLSLDGSTEVVASRDWQEKLSGLCGDYNKRAADDQRSKKGKVYKDSTKFASSWRAGSRCICETQSSSADQAPCSASPVKRLIARQRCDIMLDDVFKQCRSVMRYKAYYFTCLNNVCTCDESRKDCQCPTIHALVSQCHKFGVRVRLPENVCVETPAEKISEKSTDSNSKSDEVFNIDAFEVKEKDQSKYQKPYEKPEEKKKPQEKYTKPSVPSKVAESTNDKSMDYKYQSEKKIHEETENIKKLYEEAKPSKVKKGESNVKKYIKPAAEVKEIDDIEKPKRKTVSNKKPRGLESILFG